MATGIYFSFTYLLEVRKTQRNGYTLKYVFFMILFANAFAMAFEKAMVLFEQTGGTDPRIIWLVTFLGTLLVCFKIPSKYRN